jgi:ribonuclease-3
MEEEPVAVVPDLNSPTPDPSRGEEGSIYHEELNDIRKDSAAKVTTPTPPAGGDGGEAEPDDEFDLSDITHNPAERSREDIIAAAEAAAFTEA